MTKVKLQWDRKRVAIMFNQTSYLPETFGGHKRNFVHTRTQERISDLHKRLSQTCLWMFESLLRRCGSAVAATGTRALVAAVLGGTMCGVSPLGGGCHQPHHIATDGWSTNWRTNISKSSHTCESPRPQKRLPNLGIQQRDWESPGNLTMKVSRIWLQNFHRTRETRDSLEGTNKTLCAPGPR